MSKSCINHIEQVNQQVRLSKVIDVLNPSFGMIMPNRSYAAAGQDYSFGFNGKEMDSEISGAGNQYDYGFRIYNTRLGRFLSMDPLFTSYPYLTSYQFSHNRPIDCIDIDGLEGELYLDPLTLALDGSPTLRAATGQEVTIIFVEIALESMSTKSNAKAMTAAFRDIEKGKLYGTDGKLYQTSKIHTYEAVVFDGITYQNVQKGVNFGYKVNGEIISTKGIDQLKVFRSKSIWKAASNIAKNTWVLDFADMAIAYSEGDVTTSFPLSFVIDDVIDEAQDVVQSAIRRQMQKSISEGLQATREFVNGEQFQNLQGFSMIEITQETLNKIYSGEITDIYSLESEINKYHKHTNTEFTLLIEDGDNASFIRAIFDNDLEIEEEEEESDSEG